MVLIKLTGEVVYIMVEANPTYKKYVTIKKGKEVIYMRLRKALYGIMQGAILWYETFKKCLKKRVQIESI